MDNYDFAKKEDNVGATFLGLALASQSIPAGIFRSLAALIGINLNKTKLCPFCEETISKDACACRFCNRVLMKRLAIGSDNPGI